jgi:hypothetical protein
MRPARDCRWNNWRAGSNDDPLRYRRCRQVLSFTCDRRDTPLAAPAIWTARDVDTSGEGLRAHFHVARKERICDVVHTILDLFHSNWIT